MNKIKFAPGIHNITNDEYHQSEGLSRSALLEFKKSPLHYWNRYENPDHKEEVTPQLTLGQAVHTLILEPAEFKNRFYTAEKIDRRTNVGKERWAQLLADNEGKTLLDADMYEKVMRMHDNFMAHDYAREFLVKAEIEKSIFWRDCHTDLLCKSRPDIWHTNMICDIKTASDASLKSFQNSMAKYGYHIQAAMIKDGVQHVHHNPINEYVFIVLETVEPYPIAVYMLDPSSLQRGHEEYKSILDDFHKHEMEAPTVWPSYKTSVVTLPAYYL